MNDLSTLPLNNPFWQFSLKQWQNNNLQIQLLTLQNEQDYRINLLLLAMWLSFEHKDIRPHLNDLISKSSEWHEQIVAPIRQVRQAIPEHLPQQSLSLKSQLQACELQAEQIEQALLYAACENIPKNNASDSDSLFFGIFSQAA